MKRKMTRKKRNMRRKMRGEYDKEDADKKVVELMDVLLGNNEVDVAGVLLSEVEVGVEKKLLDVLLSNDGTAAQRS